jgi:hypothetical protein
MVEAHLRAGGRKILVKITVTDVFWDYVIAATATKSSRGVLPFLAKTDIGQSILVRLYNKLQVSVSLRENSLAIPLFLEGILGSLNLS